MSIDELITRLKVLERNFDLHNAEHIEEFKRIWESTAPTFELFYQWVVDNDIHIPHSVDVLKISKN